MTHTSGTVFRWYVERNGDYALRRSFASEELAQEYARVTDRIHGESVTRIFMAPVIEMIEYTKTVTHLTVSHPLDQSDDASADDR
jgi:hypothetical protein